MMFEMVDYTVMVIISQSQAIGVKRRGHNIYMTSYTPKLRIDKRVEAKKMHFIFDQNLILIQSKVCTMFLKGCLV